MQRTGKIVYEHAFEHADGRFLDLEVRKTAIWQRCGPAIGVGEWTQTTTIPSVDALYGLYKTAMRALVEAGFEEVYRHKPSAQYKRLEHPTSGRVLELDIDDATVLKRETSAGAVLGSETDWERTEFDWDHPAQEAFDAELAAARDAGFAVVTQIAFVDAMTEKHGALPAGYHAFIAAEKHLAYAMFGLRGVPTFAADWLWLDLAGPDIVWADESTETHIAISGYLRTETNRELDPHPVRVAVAVDGGGVYLVGDGETTLLFDTFDAFIDALELQ